jgi:hypothetical protein
MKSVENLVSTVLDADRLESYQGIFGFEPVGSGSIFSSIDVANLILS